MLFIHNMCLFIVEDIDLNNFHFINLRFEDSFDNCESFSAARMSCFAHTLQLTVRDGLKKAPHVSKALEKCQALAKFSHKSSKIADLLDELNKHINKMNVTRWNSEFMLIKSVLSVGKNDLDLIARLMDNPIKFTNNDLIILQEIIDILEPFYDISLRCQSEVVVTASMVVPSVVHLLCHLRDIKEHLSFCSKLVQQLKSSIETRFAGIINRLNQVDMTGNEPFNDPLYFMAALLDPAFKFYWIHDLKLPVNDENRLKQNVIQLVLDEITKDLKTSTAALPGYTDSSSTTTSFSSSTPKPKRRKLFMYDDHNIESNTNVASGSDPSIELEGYINDPVRSSFSEYWSRSSLNVLKKLVVRTFSVQASSAPVERVFSHAGLIFSTRRTNMSEELFRDLVFCKVNQFLL
jgi:hypothetical protein